MATARTNPITRHIRQIAAAHLAAATPDSQLLERFAVHHDEVAFAALVQHHGPLVLGVCRRVLKDWHAAEDAFQATFVVLARKAGSLKRPEALGPWLYGVAARTALKARARAARQLVCERRAAVAEAVDQVDDLVWRELRPVLDEAIAGLPEKHRAAFVLHHLQGLTVAEVARRVRCPQGTVAARLARAKEQLRSRLARRGLALSAAALAAALAQGVAGAALPAPLSTGTVEAVMFVAAGKAAGALSATAAVLMKGGLHVMSLSKVKVALMVSLMVTAFGVGVGVSRVGTPGGERARTGLASTPLAQQGNARRLRSVTPGILYRSGRPTQRGLTEAVERLGIRTVINLRGAPPQADRGGSGCEEVEAPNRLSANLHVTVQEQRTGRLLFGAGVNSDAGLVGSIVLNERNFDVRRSPTGCDDPRRGRAWRGAGQEFRVEAVPGTQRQRYAVSFPDFMFLNSIEYQVPIKANDQLYMVPFLDSGTVEQNIGIHDYRVSAGVGLRITVPMLGPVPVRLDFGFPQAKKPTEQQRLFSFWVGFFS